MSRRAAFLLGCLTGILLILTPAALIAYRWVLENAAVWVELTEQYT